MRCAQPAQLPLLHQLWRGVEEAATERTRSSLGRASIPNTEGAPNTEGRSAEDCLRSPEEGATAAQVDPSEASAQVGQAAASSA
jgi:hypothetical protein